MNNLSCCAIIGGERKPDALAPVIDISIKLERGFQLSLTTLLIIIVLFVLNLVLIAVSITDLMPRENVRYLSKTGWIIVIGAVFYGSLIYLLVGRGQANQAVQPTGKGK